MFKRTISLLVIAIFSFIQVSFALPVPNTPVVLNPNILGININLSNPKQPFSFNLNLPRGGRLVKSSKKI